MSAPTKDAAPPLPIGEKVAAAKPKKQPYPFWLGGIAPLPPLSPVALIRVTRMVLTTFPRQVSPRPSPHR